jgi:hypothetical protein
MLSNPCLRDDDDVLAVKLLKDQFRVTGERSPDIQLCYRQHSFTPKFLVAAAGRQLLGMLVLAAGWRLLLLVGVGVSRWRCSWPPALPLATASTRGLPVTGLPRASERGAGEGGVGDLGDRSWISLRTWEVRGRGRGRRRGGRRRAAEYWGGMWVHARCRRSMQGHRGVPKGWVLRVAGLVGPGVSC